MEYMTAWLSSEGNKTLQINSFPLILSNLISPALPSSWGSIWPVGHSMLSELVFDRSVNPANFFRQIFPEILERGGHTPSLYI
jgi:hypothetical protein